jgi:hypothetical protein
VHFPKQTIINIHKKSVVLLIATELRDAGFYKTRMIAMNAFNTYKHILMQRLEKKGMAKSTILGFTLSLKSCLLDNPDMNHIQINKRLKFLGWDDFELDYHTLQLAIACFENECCNV